MAIKKIIPKGMMKTTNSMMPMGQTGTMQKMNVANPYAISPGAAMAAYQKEEDTKKAAKRAPARRVIRRKRAIA